MGAAALTLGQLAFSLVTDSPWGLLLFSLATALNACALAFNTVTVNPALAECATPESMGRVIGFGGMSANAARIFAPVLWGELYAYRWQLVYYVSSLFVRARPLPALATPPLEHTSRYPP